MYPGKKIISIFLLFIIPLCLWGEENKKEKEEAEKSNCEVREEFSETHHQILINGQPLAYQAVVGNFLLKDENCKPKASFFFTSYTKEGEVDLSQRPVTFCFNGGPGSSSVWLHLGVFGPKRVAITENGDDLPPYRLVDNDFSILDLTDLVFIDPISTGYSHAIPTEEAKRFHTVEEDIKSVAEFIRLYLVRFNRWQSPKFIAGESYGTTRAAGLAGYLHDNEFIYVNGLVLVSSALNFQALDFSVGNDLPYLAFFPSYTAAAWYHKKLPPDLQQADLSHALEEARQFVINDYSLALFKGNLLTAEERQRLVQQMARLTGLSPEYIEGSNLRIDMMRFAKELLRNEKRTIGRFDSRLTGIDADSVGEHFDYDPSMDAILGAFTSMLNYYLQTDLKWVKDKPYKILTGLQWDFGNSNQYLNVSQTLRGVMTKNPYLTVFVANGYYDLATPFFSTDYTFNHLGLDASLLSHVDTQYYEAGHMMYTHRPSLIKLKQDLTNFYKQTLREQERRGTKER